MYIARRNVEGGGRQETFANNSFRARGGLRGAISDAWGYDVSAQYSSVSANRGTNNYFVIDRLQRALDVVDVDGVPTCQSVIDGTDTNCVPWNPFVPNGVTQEQLDYIQVNGLQIGRISQEIYNASVNGDLGVYGVKTPWASDGIQVVVGAEYRRDTLENTVDALQEANLLSGTGGARIGISGATKVKELFFEGRVPLAQDHAMLESLSFDTAYRYSDYGDGVQTDTYKLGLEWAPVQDVRLRGSYQRAVRAANIVELFTAQGLNLFDASGDPCGARRATLRRATRSASRRASRLGLVGLADPGQPGGPVQLPAGRQSGPETGEIGHAVVRHRVHAAIRAGTGDHGRLLRHPDRRHDLDLRRAQHLDRMLHEQRPGRLRPDQPHAEWKLWMGDIAFVEDTNINIGSKKTRGYDINVSYTGVEIGRFGSLSFNLTGTLPGRADDARRRRASTCIRSRTSSSTSTTASASIPRSASRRTRNGAIASVRAGRRRGTSTCPRPGGTTAASSA